MKTILIPTDFSPAAYNAAMYALHVAENIKSGIKLCNVIKVPTESVMAAQVAWPLEDYVSLKKDSETELDYLAKKLEMEIAGSNAYIPHVKYCSGVGEVTGYVRNIVEEDDLSMVVMGMSGAGTFSRLFLGSNTKEMISNANFPLLLIPTQATYKGIKKIAFAADLSSADINALNSLTGLARMYNAEILITHVSDDAHNTDSRKLIDNFLNDVTCKINYPNIYYRDIKSDGINQGLEWLTDKGQIDMLVMVHKQQPFFKKLFKSSHTQQLAKSIHIPLLVFPDNYSGVIC